MSVSKKHFELIAQAISRIDDPLERKQMAELNADSFAKLNPRFNRKRFLEACQIEESSR